LAAAFFGWALTTFLTSCFFSTFGSGAASTVSA
jgi:hypothetical protein